MAAPDLLVIGGRDRRDRGGHRRGRGGRAGRDRRCGPATPGRTRMRAACTSRCRAGSCGSTPIRSRTSRPRSRFYRAAADEWVALEAALGPFELVRKGGLMLAEEADQLAFLEAKAGAGGDAGAGGRDARPRGARPDRAVARGRRSWGRSSAGTKGKLNPLVANARLRARAEALGVVRRTDRIVRIDRARRRLAATVPSARRPIAADQVDRRRRLGRGRDRARALACASRPRRNRCT